MNTDLESVADNIYKKTDYVHEYDDDDIRMMTMFESGTAPPSGFR